MDAGIFRFTLLISTIASFGATYPTPNFVVEAPSAEIAKHVGQAAEHYRKKLAIEWLGKAMPRWYEPCRVRVTVGQIGAGGATSFSFDRGEVYGWNMRVQGPLDRILDSVLPHEISHTIFACHFRRPLPRWADEGAATLAENASEKLRQQRLVEQILKTNRRIPLRTLLSIKNYPRDMQNMLTLYAEGYSLASYLIQQGGKRRYLKFLEAAHRSGWESAFRHYYKQHSIDALERSWNSWVVSGSPPLNLPSGTLLADATSRSSRAASPEFVVRSQTPDRAATKSLASKPPSRKIAEPVGHASIRRGADLFAPDPRAGQVRSLHAAVSRQLASSDSWQPAAVRRRSAARIGLDQRANDRVRIQHSTVNDGFDRARHDGWIPVADSGRAGLQQLTRIRQSPTVDPRTRGRSAGNNDHVSQNSQEGQSFASGRFRGWSDFP